MTQQSINSTVPMAEDFTQEATLTIQNRNQESISMTLENMARVLLTPTELSKCYSKLYTAVLFDKWTFHYGPSAGEHWQRALGKNNANVTWSLNDNFDWSRARKIIMRKYGFTELNFVGKKQAMMGLKLKSTLIKIDDPEPHIKRCGQLMRDFKSKNGNASFLTPTKCIVQGTCNPEHMRMLKEYTQ